MITYNISHSLSLLTLIIHKAISFPFLDISILYNSDLGFQDRIYGPLDVDVCRIKLHEPLSIIVQQPLLYVRDMVPKPCFDALVKLDTVGTQYHLFIKHFSISSLFCVNRVYKKCVKKTCMS